MSENDRFHHPTSYLLLPHDWSDVDLNEKRILWRAENDKIGMEHSPPLSGEAGRVLEQSRRKRESIGDGWLFPSPEDSSCRVRGTCPGTGGGERRNSPRCRACPGSAGIPYGGSL